MLTDLESKEFFILKNRLQYLKFKQSPIQSFFLSLFEDDGFSCQSGDTFGAEGEEISDAILELNSLEALEAALKKISQEPEIGHACRG